MNVELKTDGKSLARQFLEQVVGNGRLDLIAELTTESFADHSLPSGVTPAASISMFRSAFEDMALTIEDQIAEGDRVATSWTMTGTHTGDFSGVPATGRPVRMSGISLYRIEADRMAEAWVQYDQLGLMAQIGGLPG